MLYRRSPMSVIYSCVVSVAQAVLFAGCGGGGGSEAGVASLASEVRDPAPVLAGFGQQVADSAAGADGQLGAATRVFEGAAASAVAVGIDPPVAAAPSPASAPQPVAASQPGALPTEAPQGFSAQPVGNPEARSVEAGPPPGAAVPSVAVPAPTTIAACVPALARDFIDEAFWAYRRLLPRDCAMVKDNPVTFSWLQPADRDVNKPWSLTISSSGGESTINYFTAVPRFTVPAPLVSGDYRWRVSYSNGLGDVVQSAWRRFSITAESSVVVLPSATDLLHKLKSRTGPRLLPQGKTWQDLSDQAVGSEYSNAFSMLARTAEGMRTAAIPNSPESRERSTFVSDAEYAAWLGALMSLTGEEFRRIEALAYAGRLTSNQEFLQAAKTRLLALAQWNVSGASSEASQPQANRNIYLALATGFDLLEDRLSASEKAMVSHAFNARLTSAVAATDKLDRTPYASFENSTIHFATQALLLVSGRDGFDPSSVLLPKMWALCVAQFQSLGANDGSHGSGVAYAWFDFHHQTKLVATALITASVDLTQLAYVKRMGDYLIAFTKPNLKIGTAFGDGSELTNLYSSYSPDAFRLYAQMTGLAHHQWYWRQNPGNVGLLGYINPQHYAVNAIRRGITAPLIPGVSDFVFQDTGVVSFNTALGIEGTSLHFRSSQMGSYNHAHADQNSFAVTHKGVQLLMSSGYYPYYLSPHHANVTRATRFKNAVTFDGGIGQSEANTAPSGPTAPVSTMDARGELTQAFSQGQVSVVSGDATLAYRGWDSRTATWSPLLSTALRSVVFVKSQGVILIYDWLASAQPRKWEWNYHAQAPFGSVGSQLVAENGAAKACLEHHGPAGALSFSSGFPIAPENNGPTQHHAQWRAESASASTGMVTVVKLDCNSSTVGVTWRESGARVQFGGGLQAVEFDKKSVLLNGFPN